MGGVVRSDPLVLVVDDEATVRQALERALRLEGFAVATAADGLEALSAVASKPPAVIVLDVTMPELDGWQTLERLRDLSEVPVLMYTGTTPTEEQFAQLRPELDGYIRKPARGPELTTLVDELLVGHVPA